MKPQTALERAAARCFPTVARWSPGMAHGARVEALVGGTGVRPHIAEAMARHPGPFIIGTYPREDAREIVRALRQVGVPAMYPSLADVENIGAPFRCKRLVPAIGAPEPLYMAEPWSGRMPSMGLNMRHVILLVRARVRGATTTTTEVDLEYDPLMHMHHLNISRSSKSDPIRDVLDMYTSDGPPIRIDAGRFNFDILGRRKGLADVHNISELAAMLGELASDALIDLGFVDFHAPPGLPGSNATVSTEFSSTTRDDQPAFEFYSAWKCIVQRAVRAAGSR